ncbi:hypothetical protein BKP45_18990 [Anaerobacillus alkalidiazotrophicus]|uniref:Glycosyltransferase 2-like domain-containing protein n=1 Tax=Anaerobacillus alkalidiazotrophicus TaxID=472963 RepID=A0A1S2M1D8_9BACI|nr:glycosyltransferase family A protein [Anaerobacillus alkalidiazotrophicus]OIJ18532.1 hypothetical protein BKP45_18990 [Anaerobacillus alkalidiazotrophicus]
MVSIITCTIRPEYINHVFENYERQTWKDKELIIVLNREDMDLMEWKKKAEQYQNVSVYQKPYEITVGECKNFAIKKAKFDYIAKFDDDDYYSPHFLSEGMKAFEDKNADITGKCAYFAYIERTKELVTRFNVENRFVSAVCDSTLIFKKEIFNHVQFTTKQNQGSDRQFQIESQEKGYKIYSTSKYNYTNIRRDVKYHTWKISEENFLKNCRFVANTDHYKNLVDKEF